MADAVLEDSSMSLKRSEEDDARRSLSMSSGEERKRPLRRRDDGHLRGENYHGYHNHHHWRSESSPVEMVRITLSFPVELVNGEVDHVRTRAVGGEH